MMSEYAGATSAAPKQAERANTMMMFTSMLEDRLARIVGLRRRLEHIADAAVGPQVTPIAPGGQMNQTVTHIMTTQQMIHRLGDELDMLEGQLQRLEG